MHKKNNEWYTHTFDYSFIQKRWIEDMVRCAIKNSHSFAKLFGFLCWQETFSHYVCFNIAKNMLMHCWFDIYTLPILGAITISYSIFLDMTFQLRFIQFWLVALCNLRNRMISALPFTLPYVWIKYHLQIQNWDVNQTQHVTLTFCFLFLLFTNVKELFLLFDYSLGFRSHNLF